MRVLEDAMRFPSDLELHDPRAERRRGAPPQRLARAHRGRLEGALRRSRRHLPGDEHPQGLRRRRLRRRTSLPKQMATAAGIPGADLIPDTAELFLGFTSTQKAALGPPRIANLETLGYADLGPSGYFAQGTHMHLSHLFEDIAAWYQTFDFQARVDTTFRPGLEVPPETQTVPQGPEDAQTAAQVERDYAGHRQIGHSGSLQSCVAPRPRRRRGRRGALSERDGDPSAGRLQHARQPVPLDGRSRARSVSSTSLQPASISSSSTRRATTSAACGWRWTACCPTARSSRSSRARSARGSIRSWRRPTVRTSSSRPAGTARSRSANLRVTWPATRVRLGSPRRACGLQYGRRRTERDTSSAPSGTYAPSTE